MIPISLAIRAYREQAGLTQAAFARQIGVTQGMVGHLEAGRRLPAPQTATAIEMVTKGALKRIDLRPDIYGPPGGVAP